MSKIDALKILSNSLAEISVVRFQNHCRKLNFSFENLSEVKEISVLGDRMSFILTWGEHGSIQFKCHYFYNIIKEIYSINFDQPIDLITDAHINDYMNEFSNLVGGFFRGVLESNGYLLGLSLPFTCYGGDELVFAKLKKADFYQHKWVIVCREHTGLSFICTSEIQIINPNPFMQIEKELKKSIDADRNQADNGDVEFL